MAGHTNISWLFATRLRLVLLLAVLASTLIYFVWYRDWTVASTLSRTFHGPIGSKDDEFLTSPTNTQLVPTKANLSAQSSLCHNRYGSGYITAFSNSAAEYCDESSNDRLTCFHHRASDDRVDSFCLGGPVTVVSGGAAPKLHLDCALSTHDADHAKAEVPEVRRFPSYWYNTGPRTIFKEFVDMSHDDERSGSRAADQRDISLLIKREDNHANLWHTMMEVMSLSMSLDVLRTAIDPSSGEPFLSDEDTQDSRIVFLDDLPLGPYHELWQMMAKLPPVRMADPEAKIINTSRIVVPLPGGSNPFWQGDWVDLACGESELLRAFSRRVLKFYDLRSPPKRRTDHLTVTMIDRQQKRRLLDKETYFEALQARHPEVRFQLVDFAAKSFREQVEIAYSTDILIGVHGAGLTHGMFLPSQSALVEILPPKLDHKGFHNMARFLGHRYHGEHATEQDAPGGNGDWQQDDVFIDQDSFLSLADQAIVDVRKARGI